MGENKWIRAAIPALLLHCSIGTVYCWGTFSKEIAGYIGQENSAVQWAFSFAIFFLGMSAAFLGDVVEKDIKKSSLIATICFTAGMVGTGAAILLKSLPLIYLFYGCIMGIGLGTGYLSPVKTLMLWFKDRKGLATGLAVAGFGLAKAIATPVMQFFLNKFDNNPAYMFFIMGGIYCVMMFVGHLLLKKPEGWVESHEKGGIKEFFATLGKNFKFSFSNKTFIGIWIMFYINIHCGLANAAGRLGFSAWADTFKDRNTIYKMIFVLSIGLTAATILTHGIVNQIVVLCVALLIMVNAGYGGGFSNVPTLLSDHFGMKSISAVHGMCLSAWAIAGLTGNQMATYIVEHTGAIDPETGLNPAGYQNVLYATCALYIVALIVCLVLVKPAKKEEAEA